MGYDWPGRCARWLISRSLPRVCWVRPADEPQRFRLHRHPDLPEVPGDQGVGEGGIVGAHRRAAPSTLEGVTSISATLRTGPASRIPSGLRVTSSVPPGLCTRTRSPVSYTH